MACTVAGITSDANVLINMLRQESQNHLLRLGAAMPVEQMVEFVCNWKQRYTQIGGVFVELFLLIYLQANVHTVSVCCTWDGIRITVFNCINQIQVAITVDGRQRVLVIIMWYVSIISR
jgi:hypothetical protein